MREREESRVREGGGSRVREREGGRVRRKRAVVGEYILLAFQHCLSAVLQASWIAVCQVGYPAVTSYFQELY